MGFLYLLDMIQNLLREKYSQYLKGLDIFENKSSLILSKIILNDEAKNLGVGTKIMNDLVNYADTNKQIIALTPSSDFGGNKNRLIQFYKRFGFKHNKGQYKHYEFSDAMIRYPRGMNETKHHIKNVLREGIMTKTNKDVMSVSDFINFCKKYLDINDNVKVVLAFKRTPDLSTLAYYNLDGYLKVYVKDRGIMDICRSIAHELVHHKQNLDGRLKDTAKDGADGSELENEANSKAGEIIRKWGKLHPELYE